MEDELIEKLKAPMSPADMREIRKALGFSQDGLAYFLGFTQSYISSLENGRYPIQPGTAIALRLLLRGEKAPVEIENQKMETGCNGQNQTDG